MILRIAKQKYDVHLYSNHQMVTACLKVKSSYILLLTKHVIRNKNKLRYFAVLLATEFSRLNLVPVLSLDNKKKTRTIY